MRRTYANISALALTTMISLTSSVASAGQDTLIIMGVKSSGNLEIVNAVSGACGTSIKVVNLAEVSDINVPQIVKSSRAKVVVAVGDQAFKLASTNLRGTPVIGAMTADQKPNTLSYLAPAEKYLSAMKKYGRRNVAVVYSAQTASYVRKAAEIAKGYGINLIRYESTSPADALDHLARATAADAIWMIPDSKVLNSGTAELILRTSLERNVPVFTFSRSYLKNGAAYAIEIDREKAGKALGSEVCSVLNTDEPVSFSDKDPYVEQFNDSVIDRLRLRKNNPVN